MFRKVTCPESEQRNDYAGDIAGIRQTRRPGGNCLPEKGLSFLVCMKLLYGQASSSCNRQTNTRTNTVTPKSMTKK